MATHLTSGDDDFDGTTGDDDIRAKGGDDIVRAGAGNDIVRAGGGDDEVFGNQGEDDMMGGFGKDEIYGGKDDDIVRGDNDLANVKSAAELIAFQADNPWASSVTWTDIQTALANGEFDDTLYGNKGDDSVYGDAGDDVIYGNDGEDFLSGGSGNDTIYGGSEMIDKEDGADVIRAGSGDDLAYGNAGADDIMGGFGNDTIHGGEDDDVIHGDNELADLKDATQAELDAFAAENDWDEGHTLADLAALTYDDHLSGGKGDDDITGGVGNDTLNGNAGDDVLTGDSSAPKENLVLNPGFEDGGQVGERGNIEKWDEAGNKEGESFEEGIYLRSKATNPDNILAESVQNGGNIAKLHQTVDLEEGHHYLLSFEVTDRNNDDEADGWKVSLDGAEIVSVVDGGDLDRGDFTTVTAVVTGGAGPEKLQFTGIEDSGDGEGVLLDNVALHKLGANLVENGDFSPPSFFDPAPGWTGKVEAFWEDIYLGNDVFDSGAAESVRGKANQFSNMAQEIEADAGAQLALAVDFAAPRDFDDSSAWTIHWNGEVVDTVTAADLSDPDAFQTFTYAVTSDSDGVNELRFKGGQPDGDPLATGVVLDNVKLVQTSGGADTFEFDVDKDFGDDVITDYEVGVDEVVLTGNDDLELTDLTVANDVNGDALVTSDAFDGSITFAGLDAQTILDNQNDIFVI